LICPDPFDLSPGKNAQLPTAVLFDHESVLYAIAEVDRQSGNLTELAGPLLSLVDATSMAVKLAKIGSVAVVLPRLLPGSSNQNAATCVSHRTQGHV
jgi:hypothetical protein